MVDGLKLTMTGEELRERLEEGMKRHDRRAQWYKKEAEKEGTGGEDGVILPEHICEYQQERHEWRASVLSYIRDHIEGGEVYRLGESDLAFGEILPEAPGVVQQQEYERETGVAFNLERLTKEIAGLTSMAYGLASRAEARLAPADPGSDEVPEVNAPSG
jgi:hypothetical protein